ncbi:MAG TPA: DUF3987 domain-containing protein, partial [Vicinamibacterales bacterium]
MSRKKNDIPECQRAALHYANPAVSYGWKIFAARMEGGKKYAWTSAEHAPGGQNWGMTDDLEQLRKNFDNPRWRLKCGVGVPTGWVNKIIVIENDTIVGHGVDGAKALRALEKKHGKLPKTLMSKSPTDSVHRYYRHPGEHIRCKSMTIAPGVDVKADGGMVIAPPSVREDGKYVWLNNEEIAEAPAWLIELIKDTSPNYKGNGADPFAEGLYESLSEAEKTAGCIAIRDHLANENDDWDAWNTIGLKIFNTVPDDRGFEAFDGYSQRSDKYDADATEKKWNAFHGSPPTNLTDGSFIYLAGEADPNWRWPEEDDDAPVEEWTIKPKAKAANGTAVPSGVVPVDLWGTFNTPELPHGLLPPVIEKYARAYATLQGSDPSGFAMGALTACCAVIPDRIKIQPKRHDPWTQSARMWVALIGRASTMKTPIFDVVMAPIQRIDTQLIRDYMKKKEEYEQLEAKEKKATPPPARERLKIEDVTIEVVQEIAADSPNGLIMSRDELSGFFGSMEQYGKKGGANATRPFWLAAYNGRSYTVDRVTRGTGHIENLSVNIFGGIQPEVIRDVSWGGHDDGLIERLNTIMLHNSGLDQDVPLPPEAKMFEALIDKLYRLRKQHRGDLVKLDDEALKVREEVVREAAKLRDIFQHVNRRLASHLGKFHGMFARMCLLWHIIEHHDDNWESDIDADTARRVARFLFEY